MLTFKNTASGITGTATAAPQKDNLQKRAGVSKVKKTLIGKGIHFFPKASIGQFYIESGQLQSGDKVLISGPTTGEQQFTVSAFFVNDTPATVAVSGDVVSLKLPFRIRLSDKLYTLDA